MKEYINKMNRNLVLAAGCTEPIAIAYATANASKIIENQIDRLDIILSQNVFKNASSARIPGCKRYGIKFVAALGSILKHPERKLELLKDVSSKLEEKANKLVEDNIVNIDVKNMEEALYIEVKAYSNNDVVQVIIKDSHLNIVHLQKNDCIIKKKNKSNIKILNNMNKKEKYSLVDILKYIDYDMTDFSLVEDIIKHNLAVAIDGIINDYGLKLGKSLLKRGNSIKERAAAVTVAGIDARMGGSVLSVYTNSGSGNQGITTTVPVFIFASNIKGIDEQKVLKAVAISNYTAIYLKSNLNVLSHLCGAVIASAGVAAAIVYLLGGNYEQIEEATKNVLATNCGIFCDGAKPACAFKVYSSVSTAIEIAYLTVDKIYTEENVGIVGNNLEKTLRNISIIESNSSNEMENTLIEIMTKR